MGRDAKPKEQKQLQNRKPNPSPIDVPDIAEPIGITDLPGPPEWLNEFAVEEWHFITPELAKLGILAKLDYSSIAAYCEAYGTFIFAKKELKNNGYVFYTEKDYQMPSPYVAIANKNIEIAHKFLKEFGLTPASRRKLAGEKPPPGENEFERWQKRKKAADAKSKKG